MPRSLLFVEDNEDILLNLFDWFESKNYLCDCARSGEAGLDLALNSNFDCVVLDIMLPGIDGVDVCRRLREAGCATPIIMLTAKDTLDDKLAGLESGADDYLIKPFSLRELEARINAVLRRDARKAPKKFAGIEIDPSTRLAFKNGAELRLSPSCFKILEALVAAAPGVARRDSLETLLWGDSPPDGSALRNHLHELRKTLDSPFEESVIETVPRVGWRLKEPRK